MISILPWSFQWFSWICYLFVHLTDTVFLAILRFLSVLFCTDEVTINVATYI